MLFLNLPCFHSWKLSEVVDWLQLEAFYRICAKLLLLIHHGHQADDATVTPIPVPRAQGEGATLAGDRVQVAVFILLVPACIDDQNVVFANGFSLFG